MNSIEPKSPSDLPRTLEPEGMDSEQEVREYKQMDHGGVNAAFVSDLIAAGPVGPKVIDIGCGTAEIPVLLCSQVPDIEVLGIDSSVEMLEAARIEIELGGMLGRIQLEHADCKELKGFDDGIADTVISNTVLHHIAEPRQILTQALRILSPGGRLFLRDLFRPDSAASVEALVDRHGAGESEFARQLLRQSLHAALTVEEMVDMVAEFRIPAEAVRVTSDRHWTLDWTSDSH